jgi:hypothetical protein
VTGWITEKDTFSGTWSEFVWTSGGYVYVAETTEHAQVLIGRMCTVKGEVWGLFTEGVAEVGLELDGAVLLVVAEEILDGIPDGARGRAGMHDDAEEVGIDGAVDPGEHGVVITAPSKGGGRVGGSGLAGDMGGETVAA